MKEMTKRLTSILLAAVMLASVGSVAVSAETAEEDADAEETIAAATENDVAPIGIAEETPAAGQIEAEKDDLASTGDGDEPEQPAVALRFDNTATGTMISWDALEGACEYALYLRDGEELVLLTATAALNYEHKELTDGTAYAYNIEAMDENGEVIAAAAEEDFTNTFIAPPALTGLAVAGNGVSLRWEAREGARYRVYRKTKTVGWTILTETEETSYYDDTVVSGTEYTYTVRCLNAEGDRFVSYYKAGRSVLYVQTPAITGIENTATGAKITFTKPAGADRCRVYYKDGAGWKCFADTRDNFCVHDNLADGANFTYTVRALNSSGSQYISDFDRDGRNNTFIKPPVITSFNNTARGIEIRWTKRDAAEKYLLYSYVNNSWTRLATTADPYYLDTNVRPGNQYMYTVRCISADGARFTSYHNGAAKTVYIGVPTIAKIENTVSGAMITWQKPAGAEKCRIFVKNGAGWTKLTDTAGTSFEHKNLVSGRNYTYTIRCVNNAGSQYTSDFSRDGWDNTFVKAPVITSFTNAANGIMIRWERVTGAEKYRVYRKDSTGWTRLTDTTDTKYLATGVTSGASYTYTVRCINAAANRFTSSFTSGKKTTFVGVPQITSFTNTKTGTKITWRNPGGAVRYNVYYKSGDSWKYLASTAGTSWLHNNLSNNSTYTYTIRCVNSTGKAFVSAFNTNGWRNTFLKPPTLSSVSRQGNANLVRWNAVAGAAGYRLYRKGYNGSWARVMNSTANAYYADAGAKANTLYAYTVRCVDRNGNVVSDYYDTNVYYFNGHLANGPAKVNGSTLYFENGKLRLGFQTINGKVYYYDSNGRMLKNQIVGNAQQGYRYAGSDGAVDYGYCNGLTWNGDDWNVINGVAKRVSGDSDRTLFRALKIIYRITDSDMSKSEKLWLCFRHIQTSYPELNPRIPDYTGMDWPIIYANDVFVDDQGNCLSFAAAFAYMAKGIGYTDVYCCHSGGHGWAEINGLIYDPEWGMHHFTYDYFGMTYSEPCDQNYAGAISAGYAWMHVKI